MAETKEKKLLKRMIEEVDSCGMYGSYDDFDAIIRDACKLMGEDVGRFAEPEELIVQPDSLNVAFPEVYDKNDVQQEEIKVTVTVTYKGKVIKTEETDFEIEETY